MEIDSRTRHFVRYQMPMLLWGAVIFVASSIPAHRLPKLALLSYDKLIHGTIFCIFGLLLYRAFEPRTATIRFPWIRLALVLTVVAVYGALDEFHQSFVPGRTVDTFDFLADVIGGVLAVLILIILSIRKEYRVMEEK